MAKGRRTYATSYTRHIEPIAAAFLAAVAAADPVAAVAAAEALVAASVSAARLVACLVLVSVLERVV